MKKRVGIIALLQESNTFISSPTLRSHFEQDMLLTGEAVRARLADAHHEVGGFFAELARSDIEAVPIFAARALPFGVMAHEAFEDLMRALESELKKALPLDGVLVAPHGATVSERVPDVDGYWLSCVRAIVGGKCPIIGTLDAHANLSAEMVAATDALVVYRSNPHVDQRARGVEAATLMRQTLDGTLRPTQAAAFPPLAINIECQQTDEAPCSELYAAAEEMRTDRRVVSASICLGFPYADVLEMGAAFVVVTNDDAELAQIKADELAQVAWEMRERFQPELVSIEEALSAVEQMRGAGASKQPVCLLDMGDNVGGGSPADATFLAHALQARPMGESFMCLYDPAAVQKADQYFIGDRIELAVGGKSDRRHGTPVRDTFAVFAKSDGRFCETQPRHGGLSHFDQGRTVVVRSDAGLTLMLTSRRMAPWSLEQIRHCGLDPRTFDVLVAKGVHSPLAAYREVCGEFVRVNTPGATSADLSTFAYQHRRRPMFPFETTATWHPRCADAAV